MRHLYLHVPFCRRRCSYCDFAIAVRRRIPAVRYLEAIRREREQLLRAGDWEPGPIETLYLGGGTPSLLPEPALAALLDSFRDQLVPGAEVTLEANPDDVTSARARAWRRAGITRISLGVQSFRPQVLRWMHRTHDADRTSAAVRWLREAGFENLSLDLIFALPQAVEPAFRRDLEQALALEPQHLSVYGLTVEPRTPLARWLSRGALVPAAEDRYVEEFLLAHELLAQAGFEHYEVSNYARAGFRSRHNQAYWTGAPYLGLGPAAHSFTGLIRRWNLGSWAAYEQALLAGNRPEEGREHLSAEQRRLEQVYLGLRTAEGIAANWISEAVQPTVAAATASGLIELTGDRIRPTVQGWLALDSLVAALTTSPESG